MREKWIDNAKGIAIILVILAHVNDKFSFAYGFHLVVFFVLSGYTFKIEPITRDYLNKKFSRLMASYFFTCAAIILTDVASDYLIQHDASIKTVTKTVGYDLIRSFFASGSYKNFGSIDVGGRIGAIWFLPALFFSILLYQITCRYIRGDLKQGILAGTIAIFGIATAKFIWLPFSVQSGMFAMPFLWVGNQLKKRNIVAKLRWPHYFVAQILLIVGIQTGYCELWFVTASLADIVISPIVGLAGCMMVFLVARAYNGNLLAYLGKESLTIMCAHLYALETMGPYFSIVLDAAGAEGEPRLILSTLMHLVFPVAVAVAIDAIKTNKNAGIEIAESREMLTRDGSIDATKGILIILMIVGHYAIDSTLRSIIFSCHMVGFVVLSGYFYKADRAIQTTLRRMLNSFLKPYAIAAIIAIALQYESWNFGFIKNEILQYMTGISYSRKLFTGFESVGPIYFILLLFTVRLLYMAIDHLASRESMKWAIIVLASLIGTICGAKGYWLPWSFDVACYALVFYKIGVLLREKDILSAVRNIPALYFVLSPIWAFMIYSGSMEIEIRNYGQYGLAIVGAVCGTLLIYMLSSYIWNHMRITGNVLALTGRASLYVLVVHTILGGGVSSIVSHRFDSDYLPFMILSMVVQILVAVIVYSIIQFTKNTVKTIK